MKEELYVTKLELKQELKEFAITITETILEGMDRGFQKLNVRMDNFEARLVPIESDIKVIKKTIADIEENLDAGLKAIDKHAIKLFDYDKRIGRLEKRVA